MFLTAVLLIFVALAIIGYVYRDRPGAVPLLFFYFLARGIWKKLSGAYPQRPGVLGHTIGEFSRFLISTPHIQQTMEKNTPPASVFPYHTISLPDVKGVLVRHKSQPPSASFKDANFIIYYIHGGGYFFGHSKMHLSTFHRMLESFQKKGLNVVIFSVDYDLLPKYRYPHALNQVKNAYSWLLDEATKENIPADRIFVAGDSAGGNAALALYSWLSLHQSESAKLPLPGGLWLVSPWLVIDSKLFPTQKSYKEFEKYDVLDGRSLPMKADMFRQSNDEELAKNYPPNLFQPVEVRLEESKDKPYEVYPLSVLPPTIVSWGSVEMLLDDIVSFVKNAKAQGTEVSEVVCQDLYHDAVLFGDFLPVQKELEEVCSHFVRLYTVTAARAAIPSSSQALSQSDSNDSMTS